MDGSQTPPDNELIALVNEVLAWGNNANDILADYLEDVGFGRIWIGQSGIHSQVGVVTALLRLEVLTPDQLRFLSLSTETIHECLDAYL